MSSIAVAYEVQLMGGRSIACINARDRNVLGFHRDLLTASAYGVNEFLFVYGDRPETGARSDDLSVKSMIAEARQFSQRPDIGDHIRIGMATRLGRIPAWKLEADFLLTQVTFSAAELIRWRSSCDFSGPIFAGVMVLPSAAMARKLTADVPQLAVPDDIVHQLEADRDSGVSLACELIEKIRPLNSSESLSGNGFTLREGLVAV